MTRRRTIGQDPLDLVMPPTTAPTPRRRLQKSLPPPVTPAPVARSRSKQRFTVHLPTELVDAVKNAAVALSGPPTRLTLAQLAEDAFRREVERLQKEHAKGKPFPQRSANSIGGRPIGS